MIVDAILDFFCQVIEYILNLLPDGSSFGHFDLSSYLASANVFVDMPLLLQVIGVFVAYETVVIGVRLILWVWSVLKP